MNCVPRAENKEQDDIDYVANSIVPHKHIVDVTVNHQSTIVLVDTGSTQALVKSSFFKNTLTLMKAEISRVHGLRKITQP